MSRYKTSDGIYIKKSIIDRRVTEAKAKVLADQLEEHGYNFCTTCENNKCLPVDCAHIIPVSECQNTGKSELAWNLTNIVPEGRNCHQKRDCLYLGNKDK